MTTGCSNDGPVRNKKENEIMHNATAYLKMRVLGAIDMAEGNTIRERIRAVSAMTFADEDGCQRQFT